MKIYLRPNFEKPGTVDCTRRAIAVLCELGFVPMLREEDASAIGGGEGCVTGSTAAVLEGCDLILTIGGDGTILHAVQEALPSGKPILGINTGRVGFLTQLEADELESLKLLQSGNYQLRHRMMMDVTIARKGGDEVCHVLNDAVLHRGDSDRLVEFEISCEGRPVAVHRADGVIFCTPTGSTAYNLAAGGPISAPGLELIQMTAICPHNHINRALILDPGKSYAVREVSGNNQAGLVLTVDGMRAGVISVGDEILVARSQRHATLIDLGLRDFYQRVDQKLSYRR